MAEPPTDPNLSYNHQPRILLVDDHPTNLLVLRSVLDEYSDYLVDAASGREALKFIGTTDFCVVLLDVAMPDMDGFETALAIRKDSRSRHLPIIFITAGDIDRSRMDKGFELGAVDFLVKPLHPLAVQAKVRTFVELYQERQRSELEAEQLRRLVNSTLDYAIFMLDPTGRIVTWNKGAERLKGYNADEIVGQLFSIFYPQEAIDRKWPEHELKVAQAEGKFEDEGWRLRKDGSTFWANALITAIRSEEGELRGFSKVTRDLTSRKRSEEALRGSEERFRSLVEDVKDYAIFQLDPDGKIASWNAGAEGIKGYKANEVIGQHFSIFYPKSAVESGWPEHELEVAQEEGRFEDEGWRIKKDGSTFWANVVITALRNANGDLIGFSKITRDLTARREAEENSRKLVEEVTASHRKDEFLATLAHELRNPLAPMRSALQLMSLSKDKDMLKNAQSVIERQMTQMVRLVDDLMDLSRITRGKIDLRKERVQISAIISNAVEISRPLIEQMGHTLNVVLPSEPIWIEADFTRLSQVFSNLLNNAAKYSESGGRINMSVNQRGQQLEVRVEDRGIGIALDQLPRIFEMFTQVDQSLEKSQGGLGIGLTLVKRLVEMHSGTVEALSKGLGEGAEFIVRVPVTTDAVTERKNAIPENMIPKTSLRVLIVDDNKDGAESLAMLLKVSGNETLTAYDGEIGVKLAESYRPDVILFDIGLPKINGYEACRLIRQQPWGQDTVLIAVTGWGQEEDLRRSRIAGFDHHLVKPVDPRELMQLLAKLKV